MQKKGLNEIVSVMNESMSEFHDEGLAFYPSVWGFLALLSSYLAESNLVPALPPTRGPFFFFSAIICALLHCSSMFMSTSSMCC